VVLLRSHKGCNQWLMVWCSQSNQRRWVDWKAWNSLSIGPRISTCLWCVGRSSKDVTGCWQYVMIVVGGIPTLPAEDWLVDDWVRMFDEFQVLDVVLLDVVGKLNVYRVMDMARLGRLDVEGLLLDDERGREEPCARLVDRCRRGLRGMEIGRLSGLLEPERWRWERDRRWERWCEVGRSSCGRGWL
jgi:hypothetical protein